MTYLQLLQWNYVLFFTRKHESNNSSVLSASCNVWLTNLLQYNYIYLYLWIMKDSFESYTWVLTILSTALINIYIFFQYLCISSKNNSWFNFNKDSQMTITATNVNYKGAYHIISFSFNPKNYIPQTEILTILFYIFSEKWHTRCF